LAFISSGSSTIVKTNNSRCGSDCSFATFTKSSKQVIDINLLNKDNRQQQAPLYAGSRCQTHHNVALVRQTIVLFAVFLGQITSSPTYLLILSGRHLNVVCKPEDIFIEGFNL